MISVTFSEKVICKSTEKGPAIFVLILSAPKNIIQREMTRQTLNAVSNKDLKWAFIIGQTTLDTQVGIIDYFFLERNKNDISDLKF